MRIIVNDKRKQLAILGLIFIAVLWIYYSREYLKVRFMRHACDCNDDSKECLICVFGLDEWEFCSTESRRIECLNTRKACCDQIIKSCEGSSSDLDLSRENLCGGHARKYECFGLSAMCEAKKLGLSQEKYCQSHTGLRGCNNSKREDIMIGISIGQCKGCTEFTSSVIKRYHDIHEEDIYVVYEKLTGLDEHDLQKWYGVKSNIYKTKTSEIVTLIEIFLKTHYEVLFIIDSETVFLQNWRSFLTKHLIKSNHDFLSLYHSSDMHNYSLECEGFVQGELCEGAITWKYGIALSRKLANIVNTNYRKNVMNSGWHNILLTEKIHSFHPMKSLIMKISQKNQGKDYCGENEVPYRFNKCEFPEWIRHGIEFYFDRCTNPNDFYIPGFSIPNADKKRRMWARPALSYSFYGNKSRYIDGALENARRQFSIYPGWKMWIYTDRSVPANVKTELCELNIHSIDMSYTLIRNRMSWRFLIASEPVKIYQVRDIDSRLIEREKAAVDEWLKSDRTYHVMRDHPNHAKFAMNGQMWGGKKPIPNIKKMVIKESYTDLFMRDMHFLNRKIWPIISQSVWAHDSYSLHKYGEDHPFPTKRKGDEFVGDVSFD